MGGSMGSAGGWELFEGRDQPLRLGIVSIQLEPKLARLGKDVAAPGKLRDEHVRRVADKARVDVLVRIGVLQHRRDVLAALVSESSVTAERLLQRQGGDRRPRGWSRAVRTP